MFRLYNCVLLRPPGGNSSLLFSFQHSGETHHHDAGCCCCRLVGWSNGGGGWGWICGEEGLVMQMITLSSVVVKSMKAGQMLAVQNFSFTPPMYLVGEVATTATCVSLRQTGLDQLQVHTLVQHGVRPVTKRHGHSNPI